jgi:hypothetical protein
MRGILGIRRVNRTIKGLALTLLLGTAQAEAQDWRTVTRSRQVESEQSMDVEVRYGAGQFIVGPTEAGTLYRMHLRYDEDVFEPVVEQSGYTLRIGTESIGRRIRLGRDNTAGEMELALAQDVAMDLSMEFGAVMRITR